jgi:hypothetical protein
MIAQGIARPERARSADNSTTAPAEDRDARDETICGYVLLANKYG